MIEMSQMILNAHQIIALCKATPKKLLVHFPCFLMLAMS